MFDLSTVVIAVIIVVAVSLILVIALIQGSMKRVPLPDAPSELTGLFLEEIERKRKRKVMKRLGRDWLRGGQ